MSKGTLIPLAVPLKGVVVNVLWYPKSDFEIVTRVTLEL